MMPLLQQHPRQVAPISPEPPVMNTRMIAPSDFAPDGVG